MTLSINDDLPNAVLTAKVTHSKQLLISQDINLVPAKAKCSRTIALDAPNLLLIVKIVFPFLFRSL